jgi:hypothetical protein
LPESTQSTKGLINSVTLDRITRAHKKLATETPKTRKPEKTAFPVSKWN